MLIAKGSQFSTTLTKFDTDLTAEMVARSASEFYCFGKSFSIFSGSWRTAKFKAYNFDALGAPPVRGHLHPLLKVRSEFRQIFLEMG
jgi:phenylalanyl-tRNA synthetase alpha chain